MDIVKKNLRAIVAAFLGVFHFVLLALPFASAFAEVWGKTQRESISGYECLGENMSLMEAGGFMVFAQIVFLIAAIAMLLIGAYLLMIVFLGDKMNLPGSFGTVSVDKLCNWIHMGYAGTSVLAFLATVIITISNTEKTDYYSAGISIGIGAILAVLLAVGSYVGILVWEKKNGTSEISVGGSVSKSRFVCSQCGEVAKKGAAFCPKCGGKVEEVAPTKPMCTVCGAPAKKGDMFCSVCGGKVEEVAQTKPVCELCGAPAKNGDAFCSLCGGKIVQK